MVQKDGLPFVERQYAFFDRTSSDFLSAVQYRHRTVDIAELAAETVFAGIRQVQLAVIGIGQDISVFRNFDVVDRKADGFGNVPRGIDPPEIHGPVGNHHYAGSVNVPVCIVTRKLLRHSIIAEYRTHRYILIRRRGDAGSGNRLGRRNLVDVGHGITRDFGNIPCRINAAEKHCPVGAHHHAGRVSLPGTVVQRILFLGGIVAEYSRNSNILIGQDQSIACGGRSSRRDFVNVGHGITCDIRDVASRVDSPEIHRSVGLHHYS